MALYLLLHTHRFGNSTTLFRSERDERDPSFLPFVEQFAREQMSYEDDREDESIEVVLMTETSIVDMDAYIPQHEPQYEEEESDEG